MMEIMKKPRTTQKSIKDKLDAELAVAEEIIGDFEDGEIFPPVEEKRIVNTRRERGLAPRTAIQSNPVEGDLNNDYQYARENLYNLIERGLDGLEEIFNLERKI